MSRFVKEGVYSEFIDLTGKVDLDPVALATQNISRYTYREATPPAQIAEVEIAGLVSAAVTDEVNRINGVFAEEWGEEPDEDNDSWEDWNEAREDLDARVRTITGPIYRQNTVKAMRDLQKQRKDELKEFETKRDKCFGIFLSTFDQAVLRPKWTELQMHHFREVWHYFTQKHRIDDPAKVENVSTYASAFITWVYDISKPFQQNLDVFNRIVETYDRTRHGITRDAEKISVFYNGIFRSNAHPALKQFADFETRHSPDNFYLYTTNVGRRDESLIVNGRYPAPPLSTANVTIAETGQKHKLDEYAAVADSHGGKRAQWARGDNRGQSSGRSGRGGRGKGYGKHQPDKGTGKGKGEESVYTDPYGNVYYNCDKCKKLTTHSASRCPKNVVCWICDESGHYARDCPHRHVKGSSGSCVPKVSDTFRNSVGAAHSAQGGNRKPSRQDDRVEELYDNA